MVTLLGLICLLGPALICVRSILIHIVPIYQRNRSDKEVMTVEMQYCFLFSEVYWFSASVVSMPQNSFAFVSQS